MPGRLTSLYRPGKVDGSGIEQELFGECCLARVRVRNDGVGSSPRCFGGWVHDAFYRLAIGWLAHLADLGCEGQG